MLDAHFSFYIADVIALEGLPSVRSVKGAIPSSAPIGLCSNTGLSEVFDEILAFCKLLFLKSQHGTDTFQGKR